MPRFARLGKIPTGTTFSFTLSERARISFTFTRQVVWRRVNGRCVARTRTNVRKRACKRTVSTARLSFSGHSGVNDVVFEGRIAGRKKLKPGRYTLIIIATNSAGRSSPQRLTFTIVR